MIKARIFAILKLWLLLLGIAGASLLFGTATLTIVMDKSHRTFVLFGKRKPNTPVDEL